VCSSTFVAEFRDDIRIAIPAIAEHLKDSDWHVRKEVIELLSTLEAQGIC